MGKRRKRDWIIWNDKAPQRRRFVSEIPTSGNRKEVFKYLLDNLASNNNGKFLESMCSRGEYYWIERSRGDQSYFLVRSRGNHITVTRTRHTLDGESINLFLFGFTGTEEEARRAVTTREVIVRCSYRDVQGFIDAYRAASPELNWFD